MDTNLNMNMSPTSARQLCLDIFYTIEKCKRNIYAFAKMQAQTYAFKKIQAQLLGGRKNANTTFMRSQKSNLKNISALKNLCAKVFSNICTLLLPYRRKSDGSQTERMPCIRPHMQTQNLWQEQPKFQQVCKGKTRLLLTSLMTKTKVPYLTPLCTVSSTGISDKPMPPIKSIKLDHHLYHKLSDN